MMIYYFLKYVMCFVKYLVTEVNLSLLHYDAEIFKGKIMDGNITLLIKINIIILISMFQQRELTGIGMRL